MFISSHVILYSSFTSNFSLAQTFQMLLMLTLTSSAKSCSGFFQSELNSTNIHKVNFLAIAPFPIRLYTFFVFHTPILEPYFDLPFRKIQQRGEFDTSGPTQIPIEVELFLELDQLRTRVRRSCPLRADTGRRHIGNRTRMVHVH